MGFFSSFGRGIGGMFGLSGVMGQSEVQKLEGQLSQAKDKLSNVFRAGVLKNFEAQVKLDDQLVKLIESEQALTKQEIAYSTLVEKHDTKMNGIKILISLSLILIIVLYLMLSPKCC